MLHTSCGTDREDQKMSGTSYEDKIRALLRKAESTDSPHEAEAFSRKAEELMIKWGISDLGDLNPDERVEVEMGIRRVRYTGPMRDTMLKLFGHVIATGLLGNSVRCLRDIRERELVVVGAEADLARFQILHESLVIQLDHALEVWIAGHQVYWGSLAPAAKKKVKVQFIVAFAMQVRDRLVEMRTKAEEEANVGSALVRRDTDVGQFFKEQFPKTRASRGVDLGPAHRVAAEAGRAAGRSANLGSSIGSAGKAALV